MLVLLLFYVPIFLNYTGFLLYLIGEYEFSEIHLTSENEDNDLSFPVKKDTFIPNFYI